MASPDFATLAPEYQRLLLLAKEEHHLDVVPLEALSGGQTGAFLFLVSASVGDTHRVEHFVVKFDHVNEKAKSSEVERHRLALSQAPPAFASQNMPRLAYAVEHGGAAALFYTLAGQSLQNYRTLGSNERQSRLEALFDATNNYLLQEWNAGATFEQTLHPQELLTRWLGYRLKPDGLIASFLKDQFRLEPDTEGFLIQGHIFPNPLGHGLNARRWNDTRSIDALIGLQHGDLNIGNILAKFQDDSEELKGFFVIDFALYKARMPLLYDQCYLEMSYLVRELNRASFPKWVALVSHFASRDMPSPRDVPVELAGACAVINAGRKSFERWVQDTHPSLSDDLWGQRWLAAVAAGLNFCNKAALSSDARLAGLIFSAVHLKRYCAQFGVRRPLEVRLLYDSSQGTETATTSQAVPASDLRPDGPPVQPVFAVDRQPKTPPSLQSGTVTFLFTDIESSSKLWEQHPEAMKAVLARHDAILHEAVEAHHGRVIKTTGDGIHAVFDAAALGLAAALAAQEVLFAEKWAEIQPEAVRVRMGLHTGEAEARAGDYYGQSAAIYRELGEKYYLAQTLSKLGEAYQLIGQTDLTIQYVDEAYHLQREIGDEMGESESLRAQGMTAFQIGQYSEASAALDKAYTIQRMNKYLVGQASSSLYKGMMAFWAGDRTEGRALVQQGLDLALDVVDRSTQAWCYAFLSWIDSTAGDHENARQSLAKAEAIETDPYRQTGAGNPFLQLTINTAKFLLGCGQGDCEAARTHLLQPLNLAVITASQPYMSILLALIAIVYAHVARAKAAVELMALAFSHSPQVTLWIETWELMSRARADLEAVLGPADFGAAWERGQSLDLRTTAEEVLRELEESSQRSSKTVLTSAHLR